MKQKYSLGDVVIFESGKDTEEGKIIAAKKTLFGYKYSIRVKEFVGCTLHTVRQRKIMGVSEENK